MEEEGLSAVNEKVVSQIARRMTLLVHPDNNKHEYAKKVTTMLTKWKETYLEKIRMKDEMNDSF